jgi:hypothetical protein
MELKQKHQKRKTHGRGLRKPHLEYGILAAKRLWI